MKSTDFISEAYVGQGVISHLLRKGYKKLGKGADQVVFLEPGSGLILKIFGTSRGNSGGAGELTNAQKSFKTFYDLSKADPGNEFLPEILDYEPFMYGGKPYLQIRMERLFEFNSRSVKNWNEVLADMADDIERNSTFDKFWSTATTPVSHKLPVWQQVRRITRQETMQQVIMHVGEKGLKKLWNTVVMLKKVAKKNGYKLDLHQGNFMLGSDGTPVISDPFFMGWGKST
jgi:hypothetical protein